jgi:hypothetical protein
MESFSPIEEEKQTSTHISTPLPGRIRSHALKPQHSRMDYARRKSAADICSTVTSGSELSSQSHDLEEDDHPPLSMTPSPSWLKRRFTTFSLEQPAQKSSPDQTALFGEKSFADLLHQKRPSVIAQMMEVGAIQQQNASFLFRRHDLSIDVNSIVTR